jgi:membrane-associated PAP2 superfamily phosphatase
MRPIQVWWRHARAPLLAFILAAVVLATTSADVAIAHTFFFDDAHMQWLGAHSWWANQFMHTGGRWFIRGIVVAALALLIASVLDRELRAMRRPAAYFVIAAALSTGIVGALKTLTNVDCPWDLSEFGGSFPFISLFEDRPDALRYGQCFPAAHASSGYALVALYFALRERSASLARLGLACGVTTGLIFGIAQQSRGAHFLSHDLWSAFVVWIMSLSIYAFAFRARLWEPTDRIN